MLSTTSRLFQLGSRQLVRCAERTFCCNQCISMNYPKVNTVSVARYSSTDNSKSTDHLPPEDRRKEFKGSVITWASVVVTAGVVGALLIYLNHLKKVKDATIAARKQVMIGKADLGGDWTLTDHLGNKRSNQDFLGQWVILYFGFSFCPDICPEQMEKLVEATDRLDDDKGIPNVTPIFITLDPERDTPLHLANYVSEFSPKIIGMTGSKDQIAKAAKAYRIYFSAGPKDEDNDYIIDHSIIKYLVSPDGVFCEYFGQDKTASEIYHSTKKHMKSWAQENGS